LSENFEPREAPKCGRTNLTATSTDQKISFTVCAKFLDLLEFTLGNPQVERRWRETDFQLKRQLRIRRSGSAASCSLCAQLANFLIAFADKVATALSKEKEKTAVAGKKDYKSG
jgi:hypothetical protein